MRQAERVRRARRVLGVLAAGAAILATAGCGLTIPADPGGTLESVTGGTLRVGASPEPGLVDPSTDPPTGRLVDIVDDFAASIDARIAWTVQSEESLVRLLELGALDLAVGGFTAETPWAGRAGVTRSYPLGGKDAVVLLVPAGENAFLGTLERFLDAETTP